MSRIRPSRLRRALAAGLATAALGGCGDGVGPGRELEITGYSANGFAMATDPATGDNLQCGFLTGILPTGGPLTGSWTGTTGLSVIRMREGSNLRVTHDTAITDQEVTLTLLETGEIRLAAAGAFADTIVGTADTAYPGHAFGDWTCGPEHPLARVQEGVLLTGQWQLYPEVPFE